MDLLTAFREISPPTAHPRSVAHVSKCAEVLIVAFRNLAGKCVRLQALQLADQAIAEQLFRLYSKGPRGVRACDPASEDAVRAYLYTMLKNWAYSSHRSRKHKARVELLLDADALEDPDDPMGLLDRREHETMAEGLASQLFDEVIPSVARMPPASPDFEATLHQLRDAVRDHAQVDQIARNLLHAAPQTMTDIEASAVHKRGLRLDRHTAAQLAAQGMAWAPAALEALPVCTDGGACCAEIEHLQLALIEAQVARLRVNLDARFQRARKRLLNGIQWMCAQGQFDQERANHLKLAVQAHLRFYQ